MSNIDFAKQKSLLIIRMEHESQDVLELDYASRLCDKLIEEALESLEFDAKIISKPDNSNLNHIPNLVILINNPKVVLNSELILSMVNAIEMGADICGPSFNETSNESQRGQFLFPVLNISTFKEHTKQSLEFPIHLEDTDYLDKGCIMFAKNFFLENKKEILEFRDKTIHKKNNNYNFKVIKNRLAFVFSDTYGTSRIDLIDLIPKHCKEILEIGSAEGNMGAEIQGNLFDLHVDAVEMNSTLAKKSLEFYRQVYNMPFEELKTNKKYDLIICGDVIEHMINPWEQIVKMYELLNGGGYVIASLPNAGHWTLVKDLLKGDFEYLPVGISCITHLRWFTENSLKKAFIESGFEIDLFHSQQLEPSPEGKVFIKKMIDLGYGNEQSLLTNEFTIRAMKK